MTAKEEYIKYGRKSYQKHRQERLVRQAEYYETHKEECKERNRIYGKIWRAKQKQCALV